jgi:hypothetical protein
VRHDVLRGAGQRELGDCDREGDGADRTGQLHLILAKGGDEKTTAAERRWEAACDEALPKSLEPRWRTVNGN